MIEWTQEAINGQPVSEFAESFGIVHVAAQHHAAYRESEQARQQLTGALKSIGDDLEARWDMTDSRTNPGIRAIVEQAKAVLAINASTGAP